MKIISFNVNGLRARLHQLQALIDQQAPDVIGLQEIKVEDSAFPLADIEAMGYQVVFHGQKGHYGVALMSKQAPQNVRKGFPTDADDAQRRMISAEYTAADGSVITVMNGYFPQGENVEHETKFPAKRRFYQDLQRLLETEYSPQQALVIMGDFNISPTDLDISIGEVNRKRWLKTGKASFQPEEREWFARLENWGLIDSYRAQHPDDSSQYSWFDYRSKGFDDEPKRGLRIDTLMVTESLMAKCSATGIDYEIRAMEKPSDHCPVWATFSF
ncbi:exodeoxyribonuclease-3 [Oceanospirillum multiglobuliferum]|uniref:Exodeoxyribonuclease III n=1 Tax=Oceanospirillum multiglobuliferum TaxID=64969 RepID=A0A1T4PAD1_9GAMM|nr:exodeoxyribonuclease III [Oceanospirillum multiglobuliferum]OPX55633.1 exodeoxyribonuclease III [Oceanospirillum multiglobuliferum]SJZ88510.1 exodeoxyribonuclease-3 [Oceanospirillum multiglobuliferum]